MFICDKPGSISASIANTKSGSDIKEMLLKKLSSGGSMGSRDETGKEISFRSFIKKEEKRAFKSYSSSRPVGPCSARKRCASATSVRSNSEYSKKSLSMSKSAIATLCSKKSGEKSGSKLVASNTSTKKEVCMYVQSMVYAV